MTVFDELYEALPPCNTRAQDHHLLFVESQVFRAKEIDLLPHDERAGNQADRNEKLEDDQAAPQQARVAAEPELAGEHLNGT